MSRVHTGMVLALALSASAGGARAADGPRLAPQCGQAVLDGTGSGGDLMSHAWLFGDGVTLPADGPPGTVEHDYPSEGLFRTMLRVVGANGWVDLAPGSVLVRGGVPTVDTRGRTWDETFAVDGLWPLTLNVGDFATDDERIVRWAWAFEDGPTFTFDDGSDAGWARNVGTWSVDAGSYRQSNAGLDRTQNLYGGEVAGDFELDVDVRMLAGTGQEAHVLLNGRNIYNNYEIILRGRGENDVLFYRRVNDSATLLWEYDLPAISASYPIGLNRTYHLAVARVGDRVEVALDGVALFTARDTTFTGGKVGLSTYRTDTRFDNFVVRPIARSDIAVARTDDFEDGNDAGWQRNEGTWAMDAAAPLDGAYGYRQTNASIGRSRNILARPYTGAVAIETDVRLVAGTGQEVMLLLGAQDINNNYEVVLRGRGLDDVLVQRRVSGGLATLVEYDLPAGSPLRPVSLGRTYRLKAVHAGDLIEVWLDGTKLTQVRDATFKTGRPGLATATTDARFDRFTVRAADAALSTAHTFRPGLTQARLTVWDAAGQSATGLIPLTMQPGGPPVADAGGPYAVDEFTGNARARGFTATLDGGASVDPEGLPLTYVWDFGADTFDGTVIDRGKWVTSGNVTQNNELLLNNPTAAWGANYVYSVDNFTRAPGLAFEARVRAQEAMFGWKNTTATGQYNQLVYGLYFAGNGWIYIYENGASRGQFTRYTLNASYDVRIVLKATRGAKYYFKPAASNTWELLYDTDFDSSTTFKKGADRNSGTLAIDNLRQTVAGVRPTHVVYGVGDHPVTLTVTDAAGQTATDSTIVQARANAAPVANAGGNRFADETGAFDGTWKLDFDAGMSTDDHGIYTYEWDWDYDEALGFQPSGDTAMRVSHVFATPWLNTVALRVTDHAGQRDLDVVTVTLVPGAPPVAQAAGPYDVDEFTGNALEGFFTAQFDGRGSSDAETSLTWIWDFGFDRFVGTVLNAGKWLASAGVVQNEKVTLTGTGAWGTRYLFSKHTFARAKGLTFEARITQPSGQSMVGFKTEANNTFSYTHMPYALYFDATRFRIYEDGGLRLDTPVTYAYNTAYDVRIELKETRGARYYYRIAGAQAWTLLFDSDNGTAAVLRKGVTTYSGTLVFDDYRETVAGPNPLYRFHGIGQHPVSLAVYDRAWQTHSAQTTLTTRGNALPVAAAGDDRTFGETVALEDTWTVAFDGGPSTDDHGKYLHEWDFDYDGTFQVEATGVQASKLYVGAGVHTVALRVTDHALQTHLDTQIVTLQRGAPPVADAGGDRTTEGYWPVYFDARGSTDDVNLAAYAWDFGDGTTGTGPRPRHLYWAPGDYTVRLTVTDNVKQTGTNTATVHVITGNLPTAEAAGPYVGGAGGPPVYFEARDSRDDYGIVKYLWDTNIAVDSDADGNPGNDVDAAGPRPFFTYAAAGTYTARLTVQDGRGQASTDTATVTISGNEAPHVVAVPWRADDPLSRHEIINGRDTRLKAIVRDAGALTYQWTFGDGSAPYPATPQPVANKYAVEATHRYPVSPDGTPFSARLRVWDSAGLVGEDEYHMIVQPDDLDTRTNVSIDEGLWYLHKAQDRTNGRWLYSSHASSPTASSLQAYLINGHREEGDNKEDPYVENVGHGFRHLFTRLRTLAVAAQRYGNPDTNGNGRGVEVVDGEPIYQGGMVMDALAATNNPLAFALTGPADIKGKFYHHILQDMLDAYAWGQTDDPSYGGGWRYSWNSFPDNSACQWAAIGMTAAEDNFGLRVPQFVRDRNLVWMQYSYDGTGYGYTGPGNGVNTTPSGMVQLAFDGVKTTDSRWRTAEDYIARNWLWQGGNYYGLFALVKSLRLAKPRPVVTLAATGLDWYDNPTVGLRRHVTDQMNKTGSTWGSWLGGWGDRNLNTAWSIIMLTPTLFLQPPVADAGDDIIWAYGAPLEFDASRTHHSDAIRSIVQYEWDFNGDGVYDLTTADPKDPRATFTFADPRPGVDGDPPQIFQAKLRVTDDNVPPQTDVDVRKITVAEPPHAPFADAGGPYVAVAGLPVILDASRSFDLDPGDHITTYQWDLDDDGVFFDNVELETPNAVTPRVFAAPGVYDVAVRVKDGGAFNPIGCIVGSTCTPMTSQPSYTQVTVVANLPPVAAAGGPYAIDEGTALTLDGSDSTDPNGDTLTYGWDLDADGAFDDAATATVVRTYTDDGQFDVELEVSDSLLSDRDATTVTVTNVAPVVNAGLDVRIENGTRFLRTGGFVDPGADTWAAAVDYGDGLGARPLALAADHSFVLDHTYPGAGLFLVTVQVGDDDGGVGEARILVEITNTAPLVDVGPDATVDEGTPFVRPGTFVDPDANTWHATVNYGDGPQPLALGPGQTFALSHTYPDDGVRGITVVVEDGVGGTGSDSMNVTVRNVAPQVTAGADALLDEGAALERAGSFTDPGADTFTATVDYGEGAGPEPLALAADKTFSLSHVYPSDDGTYEVVVRVRDDDGGVGESRFRVEIRNVSPRVDVGPDDEIAEGSTYFGAGSFTDPGTDTWTATVDYGDGTGVQALALAADKTFTLEHVYAENGEYLVSVQVEDDEHALDLGTLTVTVTNVAPVVAAGDDQSVDEGATFEGSGSFTDPGADTWTATVDYGDGAGPQALDLAADKTFALSHVYADDGLYTVTVTVTDDEAAVGTDTLVVTVGNVAPVVDAGADADLVEGSAFMAAGVFTDPGADTWAAIVDYGDGTGPVALELSAEKSFVLEHVYADDGLYTVAVTVTDDDGGTQQDTLVVTVANALPIVDAGADATVSESAAFADAGHFTDPGADTWTASVDYGDGAGPQPLVLADKAFDLAHVYADDGIYTVTVTVTDDDGGVGADTRLVTVLNVAPTVDAGADLVAECAVEAPFQAFYADVGLLDTHTAVIDWADGTALENGTVDQVLDRVRAWHVFRTLGVFEAVVRVTDDDGGEGRDSLLYRVEDTTLPSLECPPDVTTSTDAACLGHVALAATATDTCDPAVNVSDDRPADFALGQTLVTFQAIDASANATFCGTTVTVVDDVAPVAAAGADQAGLEAGSDCRVTVALDGSQSQDNCGLVSYHWVDGAVPLGTGATLDAVVQGIGDHAITLTVCDAAANCRADQVDVGVATAALSCSTVTKANVKLSDGHLMLRGGFFASECSVLDAAHMAIRLTADGLTFDVPAGALSPLGDSGRYRYSAPKVGKAWWRLTFDAEERTWEFEAQKVALSGLTPADGVQVEILLGNQIGRENVPVIRRGSGGEYNFERHDEHVCEPPRDECHDDDDDGHDDDDEHRCDDHEDDHDCDHDGRPGCNQGLGNGPEGCDPGNSNQGDPEHSNDENGGEPGEPGRRDDD